MQDTTPLYHNGREIQHNGWYTGLYPAWLDQFAELAPITVVGMLQYARKEKATNFAFQYRKEDGSWEKQTHFIPLGEIYWQLPAKTLIRFNK